MTRQQYQTKTGITQYRPVMNEAEYRNSRRDENAGFCLACGADADGCEPDARQYRCDACHANNTLSLEVVKGERDYSSLTDGEIEECADNAIEAADETLKYWDGDNLV